MNYSEQLNNKINIFEFIEYSDIKETLPNIIAEMYVSLEKINAHFDVQQQVDLSDFIENIPDNEMLKVIMFCAQNNVEIIDACVNRIKELNGE